MLKSLFPSVDWDIVEIVGFDMDGTLYDEFNFMIQVYRPIAKRIARSTKSTEQEIYNQLLQRWMEKGSSYNKIFDEILTRHDVVESERETTINECLRIFRKHTPILTLSDRVSFFLDYVQNKYGLFLITDGGVQLQKAKFHSLGLSSWFEEENVGFTGLYGSEYSKPSPLITKKIKILEGITNSKQVVFFGDREVDRKFAEVLGFQFVQTYCLQKEG
ncbi:HAD family hydrolase [Brevibacillus sp. BC25]|uniref:HAD family hydrolase n=1 Tax=Brevibacillus sp. BC25 TaxID=1144308 RepID=UPI0002714F5C|nr:HAD family hydrolase [Brevibacillus sp. BC25]EJL22891.1 putative HAD superfamily hydrolase [Brevibacillus sp. BC25]